MDNIVIYLFVLGYMKAMIRSLPINNGFSMRFNPVSKEERLPKLFGALFAKVPQDPGADGRIGHTILYREPLLPQPGSTNQIAKLFSPYRKVYRETGSYLPEDSSNINLPILKQPFSNYKVIIATAPPQVKLHGKDSEPLFIYVVFSQDDTEDYYNTTNLPTVYFVNKHERVDLKKKEKQDPILLVDNNRIVTGIKSKEIAKFVNFRSKFPKKEQYEYQTINNENDMIPITYNDPYLLLHK